MVLACMTLLIPAFSLLFAPPVLTVWLLRYRTLPYHPLSLKERIHNFGTMLEPRYVVGATSLDQ
jgi:hypothetical protein